MAYLLDSNVFIEAKRLYYAPDFCPAFWDWLIVRNKEQKVFSIEKVEDEISGGGDALSRWAAARGAGFFLRPDESVVSALARVTEWAASQQYTPAAVHQFFQDADYYLVAHALAHKHTVVTLEVAKGSKKIVQIPEVCIGLKIKCVSTFQMLRSEGARFILEK